MSALAEALLAAQRAAVGAVTKTYLASQDDHETSTYGHEWVTNHLDRIGLTDEVDQARLLASLDILRALGGEAPKAAGTSEPKPDEPATDRQVAFMRKLADDRGAVAPDGPLTKEQASKAIEELKAGTYNADAWSIPF